MMHGIIVRGIVFKWLDRFGARTFYRSACGTIDLHRYYSLRNERRWRAEVVGPVFAGINEPAIDEATPVEALDVLRRRLVMMGESSYREAAETHITALKTLSKDPT